MGIMKTVAQTPDLARTRRRHDQRQVGKRRLRVIGREHLPEAREPARLLQMKVGNEQRAPRRPEKRALGQSDERMIGERKGNHAAAIRVPQRDG